MKIESHPFGIITITGDLGFIQPREVNPPKGYVVPKGEETGKKFPNCCSMHKQIRTNLKKYYKSFPNCCKAHIALSKLKGFDKKKFDYTVNTTLQLISYTEFFIMKHIEDEDWFRKITVYIRELEFSFGQFPKGLASPPGLSQYVHQTEHYIKTNEVIPEEKKEKLIKNLQDKEEKKEPIDIGLLLRTYRKWLDLFPFNITYFKKNKPYFESKIPILQGKPYQADENSTLAIAQLISEEEQIDFLNNQTKELLKRMNSAELAKELNVTELTQQKKELANEKLRVSNELIFEEYNLGKWKFTEVIEKWLKAQTEYFSEIEQSIFLNPKEEKEVPMTRYIKSLEGKENSFCGPMPLSVAVEHFSKLTTKLSNNGNPFLKETELKKFINNAFVNKGENEPQKLNIGSGEKLFIVKLFYQFYNLSANTYEPNSQVKLKYISLLTDNFSNWTFDQIRHNFDDRGKREW